MLDKDVDFNQLPAEAVDSKSLSSGLFDEALSQRFKESTPESLSSRLSDEVLSQRFDVRNSYAIQDSNVFDDMSNNEISTLGLLMNFLIVKAEVELAAEQEKQSKVAEVELAAEQEKQSEVAEVKPAAEGPQITTVLSNFFETKGGVHFIKPEVKKLIKLFCSEQDTLIQYYKVSPKNKHLLLGALYYNTIASKIQSTVAEEEPRPNQESNANTKEKEITITLPQDKQLITNAISKYETLDLGSKLDEAFTNLNEASQFMKSARMPQNNIQGAKYTWGSYGSFIWMAIRAGYEMFIDFIRGGTSRNRENIAIEAGIIEIKSKLAIKLQSQEAQLANLNNAKLQSQEAQPANLDNKRFIEELIKEVKLTNAYKTIMGMDRQVFGTRTGQIEHMKKVFKDVAESKSGESLNSSLQQEEREKLQRQVVQVAGKAIEELEQAERINNLSTIKDFLKIDFSEVQDALGKLQRKRFKNPDQKTKEKIELINSSLNQAVSLKESLKNNLSVEENNIDKLYDAKDIQVLRALGLNTDDDLQELDQESFDGIIEGIIEGLGLKKEDADQKMLTADEDDDLQELEYKSCDDTIKGLGLETERLNNLIKEEGADVKMLETGILQNSKGISPSSSTIIKEEDSDQNKALAILKALINIPAVIEALSKKAILGYKKNFDDRDIAAALNNLKPADNNLKPAGTYQQLVSKKPQNAEGIQAMQGSLSMQ